MHIAQDRRLVIMAIVAAGVLATCLWGPSGASSHAALPRPENERMKAIEARISSAPAAVEAPIRLRTNEAFGAMPLSTDGDYKSLSPAAGATIQFSAANYSVGEGDQRVTITVTRSGDTSVPASADFATSDLAGAQNCKAITTLASSRCDYETSISTVKFAAGETSKSVAVLLIDDTYLEGPETFTVTLSNPVSATLGTPATATVTITDNEVANGVNPIVTASFFVPMHYLDFLNREPDPSGLAFWTNEITSCGANQACSESKRINVAGAFYLSIEFQQTGYLVERIYKTAYGDASGTSTFNGTHQLAVPIVRLNEFLADTQEIGQGVVVGQPGWEQVLEDKKQAFIAGFVQRSRFTTALPASLTPALFVDKLNTNAGNPLSPAERNQLVNDLTTSARTRAQVLRTVAEHKKLVNAESNRAFVLMQFFGYLRRNPNDAQDTDYTGYDFWLTKLNQFNGSFVNAEMVKAFIVSSEYVDRFGPAATPTPTPSSLTPEQRLAAVEAVRAKFELLKNGTNQSTVNQELLDFILSRPEFAEAGISNDSCVWATYTDGVELIVVNNRDSDPLSGPSPAPNLAVAPAASANPQPENLPDSIKARLIFTLGPTFSNPVPDVRTSLTEQNYTQPTNEGMGTVEDLKNVGGDGVFFFDGHGGSGKPRNPEDYSRYALATATQASVANDSAFAADLKPSTDPNRPPVPPLVYMVVDYGYFGHFIDTTVYGITSQFVRDYWHDFGPNSFVFIGSCGGDSKEALPIKNAIKAKGASVYAGWTDTVFDTMGANTTKFVFDRLLGANKVYPEGDGFKQRPFDYQSVATDLALHGLGQDQKSGAKLVFTNFTGNTGFRLLAPSIWFMEVDEYNKVLTLQGEFGDDLGPNSRTVEVGGHTLNVLTWSNNQIICDLPVSGAGSSGEVIVKVRQQKSNSAYLTEWEGDFIHTVTGQGFLKQTATYHIRIRADIRVVRTQIHQVPTLIADRAVVATENSGYDYECTGTFTQTLPGPPAQVCTETWSGAGSLPRLPFLQTGTGILAVGFVNNQKLTFQLSVRAPSARTVNRGCTPPGGSTDTPDSLFSPTVGNGGTGTFTANLNSNFDIMADTLTGTDSEGHSHTLKWNAIPAKNPPKADSPR